MKTNVLRLCLLVAGIVTLVFPAACLAETVFFDEFSSATATKEAWSPRRGHGYINDVDFEDIARVESGTLRLTAPDLVAPATADWGALIVRAEAFDGTALTDYAIEARMAITRAADPPKDHQVGIVLWTGNEERSIFFYRMARGLFSFDRSAPQDSREVTHDDGFRAALGEMFDVRVEVRGQQSGGSEARFYVNGEFVGSRNLGLVEGAGKIGLYVYDAEAEFDYFRVSAP